MSGPHQSNIGNRLPSMTPSMVFRLLGQSSAGPSFVLDQSVERISAAISPPPTNRSVGALAEAIAARGVTESNFLPDARLFLIGHLLLSEIYLIFVWRHLLTAEARGRTKR